MSNVTLTAIFDSHKEELAKKLENYSLPRDSKKVQATLAEALNNMFEKDGVYRQSLTQQEELMLQSAIQLVNAQQNMTAEIASIVATPQSKSEEDPHPTSNTMLLTAATTGIVTVGGGMLMGTLGAVCGAIASCAVTTYLSKKTLSNKDNNPTTEVGIRKINVTAFTNIVQKICESVDYFMETYRVQVQRIKKSYEQKEKITPLTLCPALINQVANVIKTVKANDTNANQKIISAVEMMEESLENYDLKYENGKIVNDFKWHKSLWQN